MFQEHELRHYIDSVAWMPGVCVCWIHTIWSEGTLAGDPRARSGGPETLAGTVVGGFVWCTNDWNNKHHRQQPTLKAPSIDWIFPIPLSHSPLKIAI